MEESDINGVERLRCGGRWIKKKRLEKRNALIARNKARAKQNQQNRQDSPETSPVVIGRRLIDYDYFVKQLVCTFCKACLDPRKVEKETKYGLASILHIRCQHCMSTREVATDKQTDIPKTKSQRKSKAYDSNLKLALGTLFAGVGFTQVNKVLACLNVRPVLWNTFKRCERRMGRILEETASALCKEGVKEERALTVKNLQMLKKILPEGLDLTFFVPSLPSATRKAGNMEQEPDSAFKAPPVIEGPCDSPVPQSVALEDSDCQIQAWKQLFESSGFGALLYRARMALEGNDDLRVAALDDLDFLDHELMEVDSPSVTPSTPATSSVRRCEEPETVAEVSALQEH